MDNADIAILAYGSVSRPALNAVKLAKGIKLSADEKEGKLRFLKKILRRKYTGENPYSHLNVGLIKVNAVWPFPEKEIQRLAAKCRYVFVPEMNAGKYYKEIERCLWGSTVISLPKIGGEIHSPAELMESIANEVKDDE